MTIETILAYLNAVPVRATYGAVGDVLGVRPQVVPRLLGTRRPEASWIVNGSTGEPTGYTPEQVDPRLAGTHVIRSGDELRRCLEGHAAAEPDVVSAVNGATGRETPETTVAGRETPETTVAGRETPETTVAGRETPETEAMTMSNDAKWIIGTVVPAVLIVAGLLSAQIASLGDGLNARIDDVHDRIDDLRGDLTAEIAGVHARVDDVRNELRDEIATLRGDVQDFAARLGAAGLSEGGTDPDLVPEPEESGQAADPDASAEPDPQPEPPPAPAAPPVAPAPPGE